MRRRILSQTRFTKRTGGWTWPEPKAARVERGPDGAVLAAKADQTARLNGPGVHTRNGDSIELHFRPLEKDKGVLRFGFEGGFESVVVSLDFRAGRIRLHTSEWTRPQPVASERVSIADRAGHVLLIEKTEGSGRLVKLADVKVRLDGKVVLNCPNLNVLPEMGVLLGLEGTRVHLRRFVQRGRPCGVPEYLHVGAWQMLNQPDIKANLDSLCRGLGEAADRGVELLVTPETSLTGLFPRHPVTTQPGPVVAAERKLRRFMRQLKNAPYLVGGLPVWQRVAGHKLAQTRYNASRVYDRDGQILLTGAKIHSCESRFHHGYRYQQFDVNGVPVCMHICHDGRYPDVWTVPVMFGARLILHPANSGNVSGSVGAFEAAASRTTTTSHAFYVHVNGGGGSHITGPQKHNNVIAVSPECRRDNDTSAMVGPPTESLIDAKLRIHDAFGYWPTRSFRSSEQTAQAYLDLYKAMGGNAEGQRGRFASSHGND